MPKHSDPRSHPAATRTVLLVDDEPATLRFYMAGLRGLGEFTMVPARNGEEALAVLQRLPGVAPIASPEAGVRDELRLRMGDLGSASQERVMGDLLVRHWVWLALGERSVADGFERLARLHWEAAESVAAPTSTLRQAGTWERLDAQARETARGEVPETLRPGVGGP